MIFKYHPYDKISYVSNQGMIFKYHPYDQTSFISNQGMISKYHPYDQISYIHIKTRHDIQIVKYHPYYQWFCSESSSHSKSPLVELQKKIIILLSIFQLEALPIIRKHNLTKHIFLFCLVHKTWYPLRVKYGPRNDPKFLRV